MDLALLALRLVIGLTVAAHGAQKLFGVFGGHGIEGTAAYFEGMGLRPGRPHVWLAGAAEFFGGLLIALGLFTPFGAAALIGVMTVAVLTVNLHNGFFITKDGFEYNLVIIAAAFSLAGIGAGDWSLDNALGIDLTGTGWALGALAAGVLGGLATAFSARFASRRGVDHGQPHAA